MAIQEAQKLTAKPLPPVDITLNDFKGGVNSLVDEARIPQNGARDVTNMMLVQDGVWSPRWGTAAYGPIYNGPIDGDGVATKQNSDGTFTQYKLVVDNGVLKRSLDGGAAVTITLDVTATPFTIGYHIDMIQIAGRVYICNSKDKLMYYDIAADTVFGFTGLSTPAAPTLTRSSGLSAGSYTPFYKITAINSVGETMAGTENASYSVNVPRDSWQNNTTTQQYVDLTWPAVSGAIRYNIYYSDASNQEVYLDSVSTNAYHDDSSASPNDIVIAPPGDTTTGPVFKRLGLSDNRLWGIAVDGAVWWSGTGQYEGAFSPFFGGGYIYLEKGGIERPTQVKHYRDGKGDSQATVFTTSPDGTGSEWQISLANTTIGNVSYITPTAFKVVGSYGTNSPDGVIEAQNNIYFPSSKGFFTIGAKPQLLNVLSTDEISLNIRPDVRNLNNAQTGKTAGFFFDGKCLWSVANGSFDNNEIWVLDLERNAWARPWTIGIRRFSTYTSSDGKVHLLGLPVGSNQFVEFSENYKNDSGVPFSTSYRSGLIHFDKNHRQFAKIRYAYVELARPTGTIQFSVSGTKKNKSFSSLGSITITDTSGSIGYSDEPYSTIHYTQPVDVPTTFTQSSVKKRIKVNAKLNNIQIEVTASSSNTSFAINQFMLKGHLTNTSDPSSWKQ
jgi:hypothetical protein